MHLTSEGSTPPSSELDDSPEDETLLLCSKLVTLSDAGIPWYKT